MKGSTLRRRRLAAGVACGLAVGAFVLGAALGDRPPPRPSVASTLPLGQLAGQRIVLGFGGTTPPPAAVRAIRAGGVAGVVLFADNLPSRAAGRRLVRRLQSIPRPPGLRVPLLAMTDQEGGQVDRIAGAPALSAREMGERGPAYSHEQGRLTAANLRGLGIDVDLAPVLDVPRPGGTIDATNRGFGADAATVTASATAFARGLQEGGVAATAKHFPGLGAALRNTDDAVQLIDLAPEALRGIDEAPYRGFVAAGGRMAMLSTAVYPALSPLPAAFSPAIAGGELRRRLGFEGVSITDALDTVAVHDFGAPAMVATAAARAGVDLLLYTEPGEAVAARRALVRGLRAGALSRAAFEASAGRVLRLRHDLLAGHT